MKKSINLGYRDSRIVTKDGTRVGLVLPFFTGSYYTHAIPDNCFGSLGKKGIEDELDVTLPISSEHYESLIPQIKEEYDFNFSATMRLGLPNSIYECYEIRNLISQNKPFFIPIIVNSEEYFGSEVERLPDYITEYVGKGNAAFLFTYYYEGYLGRTDAVFKWFHEFAKVNNIKKESILFTHSNLIFKDTYNKFLKSSNLQPAFTPISFSYFEHDLWFLDNKVRNKQDIDSYKNYHIPVKDKILVERKTRPFSKHFSFLSRRLDHHRLITFCQIKTNKQISRKTIYSLHNPYRIPNDYIKTIIDLEEYKNLYNRENIKAFIDSSNFNYPFFIKGDTKKGNDFNLAENIPYEIHNTAMISIISESLFDNTTIFFSEKIFKPIYLLNPFIIVGNPHSLEKLRELGYKTFSKWWDESYDTEKDITLRLNKLYLLYEEISTWSIEKLNRVYEEMLPTLEHNFNRLLDNEGLVEYENTLMYYYNSLKVNTTPQLI